MSWAVSFLSVLYMWAPYLWSSLLFEVKCRASVPIFKAKLKTYFFRQANYLVFLNFSVFLDFKTFLTFFDF